MTRQGPPFRFDDSPPASRSLVGDVGATLLTLLTVAFIANPIGTVAFLAPLIGAVLLGRFGLPHLARRIDGATRSIPFPGLGRFDIQFTTR